MKVEFINPFITAAANVLNEVVDGINIDRGRLFTTNSPIFTHGCASVIGITGGAEGRVIYDMAKETAITIAGVMNDEEFLTFDSMVSSSINELANMISGGAITILNNEGMNLDISAPTVFTGDNLEIFDPSALGGAIVVPLLTNYGEVQINVAIKTR